MTSNDSLGELVARATIDLNQAFLAHLRGDTARRNKNIAAVIKSLKEFLEAVT